jgi:CHAT domain-containing protein
MIENLEIKTEIRKYLLGLLNPGQDLTPIEENILASEDYFQDLLIEEEELIQDYVDGYLSPTEKECFEKFFLTTDERYKKVKFAESLRKFIDQQKKSEPTPKPDLEKERVWSLKILITRPAWAIALSLILVGGISLIVWNFAFRSRENQEIIASLNQAYQKERPFESRISAFEYAPPNNQRGLSDKSKVDPISVEFARNEAVKAARNNPSADNFYLLGKVYLADGELDKAIEQLEKAQNLAPKKAQISNDLGVAFLEKSKTFLKANDGNYLAFLGKALEEFEKALEINPNLQEARFNKAVCLQEKKLPVEAIEAWQDYLKLDSDSKWADEARGRIKLLELNKPQSKNGAEVLQEFLVAYQNKDDGLAWTIMSRNREMITGKLISQQLAFLFAQTKDRKYLDALKYAGYLEKTKVDDSFWQEVANFYQKASGETLTKLSAAQQHLHFGYQASINGDNDYANTEFKTARQLFSETGDWWEANIATYWIGLIYYTSNKLTESKAEMQALEKYCQSKKYNWLLANALFWVGVNLGSENKKTETLKYYQRALENSQKVEDSYNSQKILSEMSEEYRLMGRTDLSLEYLQKSLFLGDYPESSLRQKSRTYINLVRTFYSTQSYKTALAYEKENRNLLTNPEINSPAFEHESDIRLGLVLMAQKKYDEALEVFEKSKAVAETIKDIKQGKRAIANSILRIAELKRQTGDLGTALANYEEAVGYYDSSENKGEQYNAHKGRLFCYLASGDDAGFQTELKIVLELFENYRQQISEEQNRNVFFNNEQNVYDLAIDYEFGQGNYKKAFDYSERSSSRSLLDLLENGGQVNQTPEKIEIEMNKVAQPLTVEEIRQQMPSAVQLVKFNVLRDKVLIWLVSKDNFEVVSSPIEFSVLQEKIKRLDQLIKDKEDEKEITILATELYQTLLSPIREKLSSDKKICLIPDKSLFELPFAVLTSPVSQKPLIAEKEFFIAPSANVFLYLSKKAETFSKDSPENILSIGNPRLYQSDLPNLESAKTEAVTIAKEYQNPITLLESEASKEKVIQNLRQADIIHFAGHYVINERSPLLSSLILSQSTEGGNDEKQYKLANYEILGENLSKTRLVVLSACQTGIENYYQGEGMIGASRTFLAAGIPLVVASQWAVDSDATSELMIRFHKYRKTERLSTMSAVRKAQLDLLNGDDPKYKHPYYWASFMTIGGYADF